MPEPKKITQLKIYNAAYREGNPSIPDDVYDVLYFEAKALYPDDDFFQEAMPEEIKNAVKLPFIMGSLDNKCINTISKWADQYLCNEFYIASYKLDGVSMTLQYRSGKLTLGASRGKGEVGQDMTDKASVFVPGAIKTTEDVTVRGEVLLAVEPSTLGYKNRRNAVAGILNKSDGSRLKYLRFIVFELLECDDLPDSESARLDKAKEFGFDVVPKLIIPKSHVANMPKILESMVKTFQDNPKREYDIDGAVVCPDTYKHENVQYPKAKIAYKKQAVVYTTEVQKVLWDVSRLGRIIPVVCFNPLDIDGTTIAKATGFHASFIVKNVIKKGETVRVIKSKEVIPMILEDDSEKDPNYSLIPSLCPVCKNDLNWDSNSVHLICPNSRCSAQMLKQTTHFFVSLGLKDFTKSSFKSLGIDTISKAFNMTKEDILKVPGWGESSAQSFVDNIRAIRHTTIEKYLQSLGIEMLGKTLSKSIATLLIDDNGEVELSRLNHLTATALTALEGVGEKKANHIAYSIRNMKYIIAESSKYITFRKKEVGPLTGKHFCVTGKLNGGTRKEIESMIESHGGSIGSLKKPALVLTEQFLLCNTPSTSAKYVKAQKLEITIITEDDLVNMIEKN